MVSDSPLLSASAEAVGHPWCHATSIVPRLKFDLAITVLIPNFKVYLSKLGVALSSLGLS